MSSVSFAFVASSSSCECKRAVHCLPAQHELQSLTEMELRDEVEALQEQLPTSSNAQSGLCIWTSMRACIPHESKRIPIAKRKADAAPDTETDAKVPKRDRDVIPL